MDNIKKYLTLKKMNNELVNVQIILITSHIIQGYGSHKLRNLFMLIIGTDAANFLNTFYKH